MCLSAHEEIDQTGIMQLLPQPHFHSHVMIGIEMHFMALFVVVVVWIHTVVRGHEPVSINLL